MRRKLLSAIVLCSMGLLCISARGSGEAGRQDAVKQKSADESASAPPAPSKKLTIEITGGDKNVAVVDASVYLKFKEPRKLWKDHKYALNVKTNRDGTAHIPDPPMGAVLIQVVAEGWKSYGKDYELTDPGAVIKIHLERATKWY